MSVDYMDAMAVQKGIAEDAINEYLQDMTDQEIFEYLTNGWEGSIMPEDWIGSAEYEEYMDMACNEYWDHI
jgi:hypothetical protein